jgi:CRP/FNR family cyclic AMP-dependent transcriptional regulator
MFNPGADIDVRAILQPTLFGRLGSELLEEIARDARVERYGFPSLLCAAGTPLQRLRLVVAGRIELVVRAASGKAVTINEIEPGDWASWLPCFMPAAPEHDLCAGADSTFIALPVETVRSFCERHPQMYPWVIAEIGRRLRLLTEWAGQSVLMRPEQRMAKLIGLMALDQKAAVPPHTLNVTQGRLASLARCSRQSGNLLLRALEKRGLVRLTYGKCEIPDLAQLMEFADREDETAS